MLIIASVWPEPRDRVDRLIDGVIESVRFEGGS
jgi:hypothetical protein